MRIAGEVAKVRQPQYTTTCDIPQGAVFVGTVGKFKRGAFLKGEEAKYTRLANLDAAHDPNRKNQKGHRVDFVGGHYTKNRPFEGKVYLNAEMNLGEAV